MPFLFGFLLIFCFLALFASYLVYIGLQRTKLTRKPTLVSGVRGAQTVMPDPQDYRALSNLTETEAERNRLLARAGHVVDWRSDNATPTQRPPQGRIFSASGQRRETGRCLCCSHVIIVFPCLGMWTLSIHVCVPTLPFSGENRGCPAYAHGVV